MSSRIRFPLQTGESSLSRLVWGAAWLFIGLRCVMLIFDPMGPLGTLAVPLGSAGVFVFVMAGLRMRRGVQQRASDMLLDDKGASVEGGASHGRSVAWTDIDRDRTELLETNRDAFQRAGARSNDTSKLMLALRDGDVLLLAEAQTDDERDSLRALASSLKSSMWTSPPEVEPRASDARVLTCAGCGAELAPEDRDAVVCAHCGASCPIDAELRERIRAATQSTGERAELERAVREWLDQPSAVAVNRWLLGVALAVPIAFEIAVWFRRAELAVALAGAVGALVVLVHRRIARRRAARTCIRDFAARAPTRADAPCRCRCCLAALPPVRDGIVVACVYCGAHSILDIDLRQRELDDKSRTKQLADELTARRWDERYYRWCLVAALGAVLFGAAYALHR